jgi:mono/diheme cytochrome c family protein
MKRIISLCTIALLAIGSCKHASNGDAAKTQAAGGDTVHSITLPRYQPNLPPGAGREAFATGCLSCHTTRYITSQPPLTAAKWEESVRKMIKTYGAPIAEDQVQPIVQYLMATKEAGQTASWETLAVMPTVATVKLSTSGANLEHGKQLYVERCASCHGASGAADTPAAATMLPRPTDLTSGHFADTAIALAIVNGVPGTPMPGYPMLSSQDVSDLTAYSARFAPAASSATQDADANALYVKNCVSCHGADGRGDGFAAAALARPPANFQLRQPTEAQALRAITDGVPGTAMAAWKSKLTDAQRIALAQYVRGFYPAR